MKRLLMFIVQIALMVGFFWTFRQGYIDYIFLSAFLCSLVFVSVVVLRTSQVKKRIKLRKISDAKSGLVEVRGKILADRLTETTLTREACVYEYYGGYQVETTNKERYERELFKQERWATGFYLQDSSGRIYLEDHFSLELDTQKILAKDLVSNAQYDWPAMAQYDVDEIHIKTLLAYQDVVAMGVVDVKYGRPTLTKQKGQPYFIASLDKFNQMMMRAILVKRAWMIFMLITFIVASLYMYPELEIQSRQIMMEYFPRFWPYLIQKTSHDVLMVGFISVIGIFIGSALVLAFVERIPIIGGLIRPIMLAAMSMAPMIGIALYVFTTLQLDYHYMWSSLVVAFLLCTVVYAIIDALKVIRKQRNKTMMDIIS